jgi:hypothetical protein
LNEGNYWFYEQNYDSALFYYQKAETFKLDFFLEEAHLYSRTLWEKGMKKKSISILKKNGFVEFFKSDTTYYLGMTDDDRLKVCSKLKSIKDNWLVENTSFYDSLVSKDQEFRKKINNLNIKEGIEFDSLTNLTLSQDTLNFTSLLEEITKNGYPGGYRHEGVTCLTVLVHAPPNLLLKNYHIFFTEVLKGRMNLYDFAMAMDHCFTSSENQNFKPYNAFMVFDSKAINSAELIFVNRCLIGMSPYYDIQSPRLFPRGKTPKNRSKLYDYYKSRKEHFNCIQIR